VTTLALLNMYLLFNSVDLSDHTTNNVLAANRAQLSSEAFGDSWEEVTSGLAAGTLTVNLLDDFAVGSVDATIWAAFAAGTNVPFEVRPLTSARSTSNPGYTGSIHPSEWQMGGQLNTMAAKSLTFKVSGAITRNTS
jgi:hypothetical protein